MTLYPLTEPILNSSILSDDNRITINQYNLIRSDHPRDLMYYKEHIPLILRDDMNTLHNFLVKEIRSQSQKCFLHCRYRSPIQNQNEC